MMGSMCKEVSIVKDSSNIVIQVYTVYPISSSPFWIDPNALFPNFQGCG